MGLPVIRVLSAIAIWVLAGAAQAGDVRIAVAANFRTPLDAVAKAFTDATGHRVIASAGSTGLLFAQIMRGGPYDVFLAADQARPLALEEAGLAVPSTRRTYAIGRLALILAGSDAALNTAPALDHVRVLSIANPATAPYGAAALQVITHLALAPDVRIAHAQNVAGVNAAVGTGAAQAGLAAWSTTGDAGWPVPADLHDAIRQDAVLLTRASDNAAARAFMDWLTGPEAQAIIRAEGYDVD